MTGKALLLTVALLLATPAAAGDVYVDEGACPGEGCGYGERWLARAAVPLRSAPAASASITGTVQPGEEVRTITGEVHTTPGTFDVRQPHGDFSPGDEVLVYTYLGEGWFRLRHEGRIKEADLGFSPWGGSSGKRCERDPSCWGTLREELRFEWWIRVRTPAGLEGWVLDTSAFDRQSAH